MSALFAPRINRDREEFEVCDLSSFRIPSTNSLRFPEYDEFGEISDDYNSPPQSPGLLSPHSRPGSVRSTRRRSARDIRIDIEEKGEEKTTCDKIRLVYYKGFHHLAPLFILLIYSAIGAAICQAIELPEEIREHEDMVTKRKLNYEQFKQRMHEIFILDVLTAEKQLNLSLQAVEWFSHQSGLTLPTEEKNYHWTFSGALYYCATIYTTIGYGDIYPRTGTGKTFTVLYAIIGIPMVLAILGDLGKALCRAVSVGWKLLYGFVHNRARVDRQWFNRIVSSQHDQMDIPALLAVGLAVFWIFFVSGLFMIWESWYYSDALYFFFISLTTIGLGQTAEKHSTFTELKDW